MIQRKSEPLVLKFGGAAMADIAQFPKMAQLIKRRLQEYTSIVVVVSAMGKATDELMSLSKKVHPDPGKRELDMLITAGERISISLLAMALVRDGIDAISFTGSQAGIITTDSHSEARVIDVRPLRIRKELDDGKVVIVAGFQGVSTGREITTLGRGGSDTSAVALGIALGATKVEFYKDVPGIGEENPKENPNTKIFSSLSYQEALAIVGRGADILHDRCLHLAERNHLPLEIRPFFSPNTLGTTIATNSRAKPSGRPVFESVGLG